MVRQGMLDMAGQVGYSAEELVAAMYKVSSGGQIGAKGLDVLRASAEGAKAENADLAVVADAVTSVLQDYVAKNYAHLVGADAVAGSKNLLVLLRGPRLGELAVLDAKTLAELKTIKMPWCEAGGGGPDKASSAAPAPEAEPAPPPAAAPPARATAPAKAAKKGKPKADDPDSGGQ